MEFISSPILKKETLVKVVALIGRDSPVGWTAQGLSCLNYKSFGLDGIFFPSSSCLEWYISQFISGRVG